MPDLVSWGVALFLWWFGHEALSAWQESQTGGRWWEQDSLTRFMRCVLASCHRKRIIRKATHTLNWWTFGNLRNTKSKHKAPQKNTPVLAYRARPWNRLKLNCFRSTRTVNFREEADIGWLPEIHKDSIGFLFDPFFICREWTWMNPKVDSKQCKYVSIFKDGQNSKNVKAEIIFSQVWRLQGGFVWYWWTVRLFELKKLF